MYWYVSVTCCSTSSRTVTSSWTVRVLVSTDETFNSAPVVTSVYAFHTVTWYSSSTSMILFTDTFTTTVTSRTPSMTKSCMMGSLKHAHPGSTVQSAQPSVELSLPSSQVS